MQWLLLKKLTQFGGFKTFAYVLHVFFDVIW